MFYKKKVEGLKITSTNLFGRI